MQPQSALGATFKPPFARNLGIILAPMLGVGLVLTFVIGRGYGAVLFAANSHAEPRMVPGLSPGKVRFSGTATRPAGSLRAPSGAEGIAWVGTAGNAWKNSAGGIQYFPQCEIGNVSGLVVKNGVTSTRVELVPPGKELVQARHDQLGEPAPLVDFGRFPTATEMFGDDIPASVREQCGARLNDPKSIYVEAVLRDNAHVEILGCFDGSAIVPCGDRVDTITIGSLQARIKNTKESNASALAFAGVFNLALSAILGAIAASALVRVRLSAKDAAKDRARRS